LSFTHIHVIPNHGIGHVTVENHWSLVSLMLNSVYMQIIFEIFKCESLSYKAFAQLQKT